jgi:hypothetical protein
MTTESITDEKILDVLSAQVPTNYVAIKDVYSLKDEPEMVWKEDPVVYAEYGTSLWQIHNQTNKIHKKCHHPRCIESIITTELMFLWKMHKFVKGAVR